MRFCHDPSRNASDCIGHSRPRAGRVEGATVGVQRVPGRGGRASRFGFCGGDAAGRARPTGRHGGPEYLVTSSLSSSTAAFLNPSLATTSTALRLVSSVSHSHVLRTCFKRPSTMSNSLCAGAVPDWGEIDDDGDELAAAAGVLPHARCRRLPGLRRPGVCY